MLSRNLIFPAKPKLATEESIAVNVFKYLISFDYTEQRQKLTLNCNMAIVSFHSTDQSIWIQSQEILTLAIYIPTLIKIGL